MPRSKESQLIADLIAAAEEADLAEKVYERKIKRRNELVKRAIRERVSQRRLAVAIGRERGVVYQLAKQVKMEDVEGTEEDSK